MREATLIQIRDYFEIPSQRFTIEWKALNDEEKQFFKVGVGEVLGLTA